VVIFPEDRLDIPPPFPINGPRDEAPVVIFPEDRLEIPPPFPINGPQDEAPVVIFPENRLEIPPPFPINDPAPVVPKKCPLGSYRMGKALSTPESVCNEASGGGICNVPKGECECTGRLRRRLDQKKGCSFNEATQKEIDTQYAKPWNRLKFQQNGDEAATFSNFIDRWSIGGMELDKYNVSLKTVADCKWDKKKKCVDRELWR